MNPLFKYFWTLLSAVLILGARAATPDLSAAESIDSAAESMVTERDDTRLIFEYSGELLPCAAAADFFEGMRRTQTARSPFAPDGYPKRFAPALSEKSVSFRSALLLPSILLFTDRSLQYVFRLRRIII